MLRTREQAIAACIEEINNGIERMRGTLDEAGACPSIDADGVAETEADHFGNCPVCRAFIDMRDLGQILAHVHDQEIEISEGEGPPPCEGPMQ